MSRIKRRPEWMVTDDIIMGRDPVIEEEIWKDREYEKWRMKQWAQMINKVKMKVKGCIDYHE